LLTIAATLAAIPAGWFLIEVVAAVLGEHRVMASAGDGLGAVERSQVCVLVPAHDEAEGIGATVAAIRQQLAPGDRLLVVADNCTDETARIAAEAGAEVAIRHEPSRRGKGYALAFGIDQLRKAPPACVIVMDADCTPGERLIDTLAHRCAATNRPVQARYVMAVPEGSPPEQAVAAFSWLVRNYVRPLGLAALNLPSQLMGTGMAFPWNAIAQADLASGHIVEDLKLGLDLANAGHPPLFEPQVAVTSTFARSEGAMVTQRRRWETGAVAVLTRTAPRSILRALRTADLRLLALALDAMVPPLVPFVMVLSAFAVLATVIALSGGPPTAAVVASSAAAAVIAGLILAWLVFGRRTLALPGPGTLLAFVARKFHIYQRPGGWVRTGRN
jgi:cellulose synthase/poly-beta-1,6-N-acetylglucosamine synthase-like glycosyltransferase